MNDSKEIKDNLMNSSAFRKVVARSGLKWFMAAYLSDYIEYEIAPFHDEMFELLSSDFKMLCFVAFRNSAKSTICSLALPLWMALSERKKYIILISQTKQQSLQLFANIKNELETNELLIRDFGPFKYTDETWRSDTLILKDYETQITCLSTGENIRGTRYRQHRPDLIICDDIESLDAVKTLESRDKTYNWLLGDVFPAGGDNSQFVIVGSLLHDDSSINRLKHEIQEGNRNGIYKEYPLLKDNKPLWPARFPNEQSIEDLKKTIGNERNFQREYMLKIFSKEDQIINAKNISYYDPSILNSIKFDYVAMGIDLAIAQTETADYTAMILGGVIHKNDSFEVYILPYVFNQRVTFAESLNTVKELIPQHKISFITVEDVGYQKAMVQELKKLPVNVEGAFPNKFDKYERLNMVSTQIVNGIVKFPVDKVNPLINQLVNFASEPKKDMVDALVYLLKFIVERENKPLPNIRFFGY